MNHYNTRPSTLPFFTYIQEKRPWAVLWASDAINEVHISAKVVPADRIIRSLETSIETFKGEFLNIKEEGAAKAYYEGVQSYLCNRWVMDMYPLVLPHKVKRSLEGFLVLCLRWWKRNVIHDVFKWLRDKYGGYNRTREE